MNQPLLIFLLITDNFTWLFQNVLAVVLCIAGFYICSKCTSPREPSRKMMAPVKNSWRNGFIRAMIYLLSFFLISGIYDLLVVFVHLSNQVP